MTAPRVVRALCLLLLLASATPLIATATADTGKQGQAQFPTLLWHSFPLRERAPQQLGPKLQVKAIARKTNRERSVPATQTTTAFPHAVIIGLVAATMLVAVGVFLARQPVGLSATDAHENEATSARARTADAIVATDDGAQTATAYNHATSPTEQEPAMRISAFQPASHTESLSQKPHPHTQPLGENSKPEWDAETERPDEQRVGIERCEIVLWTGYVKKQLYAAPLNAARTLEAVAESSYFRLRDADVPTATAEHALEGLIAQLQNEGWQVVSKGAHWYHYRLERVQYEL